MQPILGLLEDDRPLALDHRVADLQAAVRGQAVHDHGVLRGLAQQVLVELVAFEILYALLRVFPKTGKTHQIRVHIKHVGVPLVVDLLYNPPTEAGSPGGLHLSSFKRGYRPKRGEEERPLIDRLTLHAERLRFDHPDGRRVEVVAPLPKDFRATLNMMSKYA